MSAEAFNPQSGPVLVEAEATGPIRTIQLKLVLDTGATTSLIDLATLIYLGFDPDQAQQRVPTVTGSTVEVLPIVVLTRLSALGRHRIGFPVLAHALPASSGVDGLLGLDFLRGLCLTVDFRAGNISLI